jgi:hypothetical protein
LSPTHSNKNFSPHRFSFCSGQPIKIISSGTGQSNVSLLGSPTKAITLAQAQQMGLLSPTKLQHIVGTHFCAKWDPRVPIVAQQSHGISLVQE